MRTIKIISAVLLVLSIFPALASAQLNVTWNPYPSPNITNVTGIFLYDNSVTNTWFVSLLIIGLWLVMLMVFSMRAEMAGSLAASSIISLVLSIILRTNSLIGDAIPMIFIVLSVVGIVMMFRFTSGF